MPETGEAAGGGEGIELRSVGPGWAGPLADFFRALREAGDETRFHPHPLTDEEAVRRESYAGKDLYLVLVEAGRILAYGMLRGWDEGYEVPSLGIAVHPKARGRGMGRAMMRALHDAARRRGASAVRLRVYDNNVAAVRLYEGLGYRFRPEGGALVGTLEL